MRAQLEQYVKLLFAGTPDREDMQQEILQNTLDRYDDLVEQGKAPEAAYRLAISGIGDINEVLDSSPVSPAPVVTAQAPANKPAGKSNQKLARAVAIGMYICSVIPLLALGNIGNGVIGLCVMLLLIAGATVLLVMNSDEEEEKVAAEKTRSRKSSLDRALNAAALAIFLLLSFATNAWYITWLIFPIMAAVKGILRAYRDLKGGREG